MSTTASRSKKSAEAFTPEEQAFLDAARKKFRANADWLEFESFAFGMHSPLFSKNRSHRDLLTHPLYVELTKMWLDLGVKQGRIKADAPRRKTRRRR